MNINYIKQHCTDLSHDDTIRKKYYRKRFNSLFYIMLGVLFIGVVGMGVMAILSISHNKDYNLSKSLSSSRGRTADRWDNPCLTCVGCSLHCPR